MKPISLLPALFAAAPLLGQSLVREVAATGFGSFNDAAVPGTGTQFNLGGGPADADAGLAIPDDDGVEILEVQGNAVISTVCTIEVRGLDSSGTLIFGSGFNSIFACGGPACEWGPADFAGNSFSFTEGTVQPIAQGEIRTVTLTNGICNNAQGPCVLNSTFTSASLNWDDVLAYPLLRVQGNMDSISFQAANAAGAATQVEVLDFSLESFASAEHVLKLELLPAPLTPYCTSPAGSNGSTATLSAFGSQQTLTKYLTVRASGLPNGVPGMLLVGTEANNRPLGFANICVGGATSREGGIVAAVGGVADFHINLLARLPGDTLFLQVLHRDTGRPFATSEGASFTVLPR